MFAEMAHWPDGSANDRRLLMCSSFEVTITSSAKNRTDRFVGGSQIQNQWM